MSKKQDPLQAPAVMPSLFDEKPGGSNLPEFTVAELSQLVKRRIEEDFGHVRVRGEVTQPKLHSSGHMYFTLKDEDAVLAAVCWRGQVGKLKIKPEEGMEVVATGRLTTFPGQSKYQIVIEQVALAGVGALLKMLEERKKKLAAEGLFDEARKKPLPFLPQVIGVVTSPTGAVIRDILHRLAERFPARVLVWPVNVQGEGAAAQITAAIQGFNTLEANGALPRPDVLIVARGGGSLEDMLPFYEESVVRAAASSRIPLISAIGHETDTCLLDYAADRRAPTPTAAAEMAVPVRLDLLRGVMEQGARLANAAQRFFEKQKMRLEQCAGQLVHPRLMLETMAQRLDDRAERLDLAMQNLLQQQEQKLKRLVAGLSLLPLRQQLAHAAQKMAAMAERLQRGFSRLIEKQREHVMRAGALLESQSYMRVLQRGFVLVRDAAGNPVLRAAETKAGDDVSLTFADGRRNAKIIT